VFLLTSTSSPYKAGTASGKNFRLLPPQYV
jgi:hypothetical protein